MQALRLRRERLEWRCVDGEVIAVDLDASQYLGVNEAAAPLWEALAAGTTRDELVSRLAGEYGLDEARAARDVDEFLAALSDCRLLDETAA